MKHRKSAFAVIASATASVPTGNVELATYACKSCGSSPFAVNASITPFCIHCGSDAVKEVTGVRAEALPKNEDMLSSIVCPECGKHNILADATALALAGVMSCVVCGSEMSFDTSILSEMEDTLDTDMEDEAGTEETDDEDNFGDIEEAIDGEEDEEEEEEEAEAFDEETDEFDKETLMEASSISLVDIVSASTPAKLGFVRLAPETILAFVGKVCVARLDDTPDYKHHDIFAHDSFMQSLASSLDNNGVDPTLEDFEFDVPKIQIDADQFKEHETSKAVQKATAAVMAKADSMRDELRQCLSIAAVGLNKGFWKDKQNELKVELYQELTTAGVRNPATIIDSVFARASDDHHKTLFEIAFDLLGKPVETRNSLADAVGTVNYQPVASVGSASASEDHRLEQTLKTKPVVAATAEIPKGRLFAVA